MTWSPSGTSGFCPCAPLSEPAITPELIAKHGLTPEEYAAHRDDPRPRAELHRTGHLLGDVERALLVQKLAARTAQISRPKARACWSRRARKTPGVIDIGDGWGVAFKMESHNHPSAIEPFQGAATGVGGIIRDIFTMGARPVFSLNSLRFGPIQRRQRDAGASQPAAVRGRRRGHRALRQLHRHADHRRRDLFRRKLRGQSAGQRLLPRRAAPRADRARRGAGASATRCSTSARKRAATAWRARRSPRAI